MAFLEKIDYDTISDPRIVKYINETFERSPFHSTERNRTVRIKDLNGLVKRMVLLSTSGTTNESINMFRQVICRISSTYGNEITGSQFDCQNCGGCSNGSYTFFLEKVNTFIKNNS
jgi:hypothetical protein